MSDTLIIVNPNAGGGSTGKDWPAIAACAREYLGVFTTRFTTAPGEARDMAARGAAGGSRRIICVGGDGTLNEVVNGVMALTAAQRKALVLGFIPNGTGCDIVKTIAIP